MHVSGALRPRYDMCWTEPSYILTLTPPAELARSPASTPACLPAQTERARPSRNGAERFVQVVLKIFASPTDVLTSFDVDCCGFACERSPFERGICPIAHSCR